MVVTKVTALLVTWRCFQGCCHQIDTRRDALKTWSISPEEWCTLIADLPYQPLSGVVRTYIDWDDSKRMLASIWVWVRIAQGEHIFAPPIRPHLDQRRPSNTVRRHIHNLWPLISAEYPTATTPPSANASTPTQRNSP
jgi:hypothetical protein